MTSLDTLPPDQRAVLQLVLQRERSYGEIAQQLSIDSASVRERAHAALEALGPGTRIPKERREEIGDYLLGQLPAGAAARARERIAQAPGERAWARVVASELGLLAKGPLPEIPLEATGAAAAAPDAAVAETAAAEPTAAEPTAAEPTPAEPTPAEPTPAEPTPAEPTPAEPAPAARTPAEPEAVVPPSEPVAAFAATATEAPPATAEQTETGADKPPDQRPTSRRGGAILLALGGIVAIAVVAVIVLLVANSGSSNKHGAGTAAATTPTTAATTSTTTSATATARPIAQVNLVSPTHNKKVAGVAEIIKQGSKEGLVIVAQGIPANTSHDAYAVWLYNSQSDNHILGFVNPGVKTDGKLQTAGPLPSNAAHFKQLLVTLETHAKPHGPGKIVLQGPLSITQ